MIRIKLPINIEQIILRSVLNCKIEFEDKLTSELHLKKIVFFFFF